MSYYQDQLKQITKENIIDIELFSIQEEQNLYCARIKIRDNTKRFTFKYITITPKDSLNIAINVLQDALKHLNTFEPQFININYFKDGSLNKNILNKITKPLELELIEGDLYKNNNNKYFIKKNNGFKQLEEYNGNISFKGQDLLHEDSPILRKIQKDGIILSHDNFVYYFKTNEGKIINLNDNENVIGFEVKKEKNISKVNNIKFAGDLKEFISKLFNGIDIEKTKDDSSVEIINGKDITSIGDKKSGTQQPFVRGSLIAFGQYVRIHLKNHLLQTLELNPNEVVDNKTLKARLKEFNQENHPKKVFDAEDMFNHFTGVSVHFNKNTILKMKISETGEVKEFTGEELFKQTNKLLSKFIENNIDIILYAKDIWTEIALRNRNDNDLNIISDARFLSECQISLNKHPDAFLTLILPLQKDGNLLLNNFTDIFNLYHGVSNVETFVALVSKPNILNPYLINNDEVNKFLNDNNLEFKRNSVYSTKDREEIYNKFLNSKTNKDRPIFSDKIEKRMTSKLVNEAEELSTLLVLNKFLKLHPKKLLPQHVISSTMDQDIKNKGLDNNVLIIESKRGDFLSLTKSATEIYDKIKHSDSKLTLLSTVSGGGKDTITSILENVAIKKLPFDNNLNESFDHLIELLNEDNLKMTIQLNSPTISKEEVMEIIINQLQENDRQNAAFLNQIDTLNISFVNSIGKVQKELKSEIELKNDGINL